MCAALAPDKMKSIRFDVCGMPYSIATPQSPGIASSLSTLATAIRDSFQDLTSDRATPRPVRDLKAPWITSSMSFVNASFRNLILLF